MSWNYEQSFMRISPYQVNPVHYATHDTCLTHGYRKLRLAEDFEILRVMCDFKTLRLTPARCQPDVTF